MEIEKLNKGNYLQNQIQKIEKILEFYSNEYYKLNFVGIINNDSQNIILIPEELTPQIIGVLNDYLKNIKEQFDEL